jgi:hypothetical protein
MLGRMTWTAPQINRQRTPIVAGERKMLEAWLDFHRQTLLGKCSGLTPGQLQQRAAPPPQTFMPVAESREFSVAGRRGGGRRAGRAEGRMPGCP